MQVNIKPEQEWIVREALATGAFGSAEEVVAEALAGGLPPRPETPEDHARYQRLAQEAIDRGGYREREPDWKERILALAESPEVEAS